MHYTTKLFARVDLNAYFEKRRKQAERRVSCKRIRPDTDQEDWIKEYMEEFALDPIVLDLENRKLEYKTRASNPELLYVLIKVPYTASKGLADLTPPTYKRDDLPLGVWGNNYITLHFQADILDSNDVHRAKYDKTVNTLIGCVEAVNKEVVSYNEAAGGYYASAS